MKSIILVLLLFGCYQEPKYHHTARYKIPVHIETGVPIDESTVDLWVDDRADEWLAHKTDWGCDRLSDDFLVLLMRSEPVWVYPGYFLDGFEIGTMGVNYYGYEHTRIEVSIDFPGLHACSPWDPPYVQNATIYDLTFNYGLRPLPHEWTHTARGAWHPN